MRSKSRIALMLGLVVVLAFLSACGGAEAPAEEPAAEEEAPAEEPEAAEEAEEEAPSLEEGEQIKAAVLLPGSANDQSWSQLGVEGIQSVGEALGAETAYSENVEVADSVDALRDYASRGYQLIITHGGQYEEAALRVADEYPDVQFVVIAGTVGNDTNVAIANVNDQQIGYVTGYIAAKMSKSGKIGQVSHLEGMPVMTRINGAWRMGAQAANPDIETCLTYISDGEDVAAAREAALAMVESGADVVYSEMNRGAQGIVDVGIETGVWVNARDAAEIERAPDVLVQTVDYRYDLLYPQLADEFSAGNLGGGNVDVGFHTDPQGFVINFTDNVPDEFRSEVDEVVIPYFLDEVPDSYLAVPEEMGARGCQ